MTLQDNINYTLVLHKIKPQNLEVCEKIYACLTYNEHAITVFEAYKAVKSGWQQPIKCNCYRNCTCTDKGDLS